MLNSEFALMGETILKACGVEMDSGEEEDEDDEEDLEEKEDDEEDEEEEISTW